MHDQAAQLRDRILGAKYDAKTVAVISGKGGVGKSNVVLNFAIELQKMGRRTLIIDLDIGMGNIDVLLGKTSKHTIMDFFNTNLSINDMIEVGPKDLHFIAGASGLNDLFHLDEQMLNKFLDQYHLLCKTYDYIFFDMGAGVSESSMSFVLAADECLLVTTPEPTSMTDAYSMVKQIFIHQPNMSITMIMNRSSSNREGKKALERMNHVVEQFLSKTIHSLGTLPTDSIVSTAVIRQIPYVILKPHAPISRAMDQLATQYDRGVVLNRSKEPVFLAKLKTLFRMKGDG